MFHYKEKHLISAEDRGRVQDAFKKYSSNDGLNKTDYKVAWIYLFGYKPSKVIILNINFKARSS